MDKLIIDHFRKLIFDKTGIVYKDGDEYRILTRLNSLKADLNIKNDVELYEAFKDDPSHKRMDLLLDISTNNETYFFRDEKQFKFLSSHIEAQIPLNDKFNIWSCGCSCGQEPYSILLSAMENEKLSTFYDLLNVEASDLCNEALEKAKEGVYTSLEVGRGLDKNQTNKYFSAVEKNWQISPMLREKIKFSKFNLISDIFPVNKYHVIFCRNVLIYQSIENRRKILIKMASALKEGGYLFMGAGESLIGIDINLTQRVVNGVIYFEKISTSNSENMEALYG